jgi:hypothetical protein
MFSDNRKSVLAAVVSGLLASSTAHADVAMVDNGLDSGPGSLREALASGATEIVFATSDDIIIYTPLTYAGEQALELIGNGNTISTPENINMLQLIQGASLTVSDLHFKGPGGWSIQNQAVSPAGKGIFIDVRDGQKGKVSLTANNVSVSGVANHGIHISDCDLADECGGGGGGAGGGSPASIEVTLNGVSVDRVGYGRFDADGLRVDERNTGNIVFNAWNSSFTYVGADGVELDEGQGGNVKVKVSSTVFNDNGGYCDPDLLEPFLPDPDEAEFDPGEFSEAEFEELIRPIHESPDPRCIEVEVDYYPGEPRFVAAYEIAIDVDDGIDIDEAGNGNIISTLTGVTIERNLDEGADYDEEDRGGIFATIVESSGANNTDDAFKHSEAGPGSVVGKVYGTTATGNGGVGMVFEEEDQGSLKASVTSSSTSGNDGGELGVEAVQEDQGGGILVIRNSEIMDGYEAEGVKVIEK